MYWFIDLSTSRVSSAGLASIPIRSITKSSPEPIRGSFRNSRNDPYVRVSMVCRDSCRWLRKCRQPSTRLRNPIVDKCRHLRQLSTTRDITYASPSTTIDKCRQVSTSLRNNYRHFQKLAIALGFLTQSRALLSLFLFFSSSINLTTFLVDLVRDLRHRDPRSRHRQTGSLAVRSLSPSS